MKKSRRQMETSSRGLTAAELAKVIGGLGSIHAPPPPPPPGPGG